MSPIRCSGRSTRRTAAADFRAIYNEENDIDPQTIRKKVSDILQILESQQASTERRRREATDVKRSLDVTGEDLPRLIMSLEDEMRQAAKELRFEYAAVSVTRSTNSSARCAR